MAWGDRRPWGLDPVCPKEVAEGSWSCLQKEFKDTRTTQWMGDTSGKLTEAKSTLLRHESGQGRKRKRLGFYL